MVLLPNILFSSLLTNYRSLLTAHRSQDSTPRYPTDLPSYQFNKLPSYHKWLYCHYFYLTIVHLSCPHVVWSIYQDRMLDIATGSSIPYSNDLSPYSYLKLFFIRYMDCMNRSCNWFMWRTELCQRFEWRDLKIKWIHMRGFSSSKGNWR